MRAALPPSLRELLCGSAGGGVPSANHASGLARSGALSATLGGLQLPSSAPLGVLSAAATSASSPYASGTPMGLATSQPLSMVGGRLPPQAAAFSLPTAGGVWSAATSLPSCSMLPAGSGRAAAPAPSSATSEAKRKFLPSAPAPTAADPRVPTCQTHLDSLPPIYAPLHVAPNAPDAAGAGTTSASAEPLSKKARTNGARPAPADATAAAAPPVALPERLYSMLPFGGAPLAQASAGRPLAASEAPAPCSALPGATLENDEMLSMFELSELHEFDVFQVANHSAQEATCAQQSLKEFVSYLADHSADSGAF